MSQRLNHTAKVQLNQNNEPKAATKLSRAAYLADNTLFIAYHCK